MSLYPAEIYKRFNQPANIGTAELANASGTAAAFVCGSILRFTLRIENKHICEVKFKTNGCGFMIAVADIIAEAISNTLVTDFNKARLKQVIVKALGKFPENREHCLNTGIESLQTAFSDYRARQIEEFVGEKALICTCFGVSEETIEVLVMKKSLESVEEVSRTCNAGSGCGSCQPLIQEIIDSAIAY